MVLSGKSPAIVFFLRREQYECDVICSQRNGSYLRDGLFNMATGEDDISQIGVLHNWNYKDHTDFYEGSCNAVVGSSGEFWPPKRTKQDVVGLFSPDLCRSVPQLAVGSPRLTSVVCYRFVNFYYENEVEMLGMKAYKYKSGRQLVDNGTLDEANSCFCGGDCVRSGVLNVSSCRLGAPAFVSYPHFYLADEYYRDSVVGMTPSEDKHDIYIVMEPVSYFSQEFSRYMSNDTTVSSCCSTQVYHSKLPPDFK